MSSAVKSAAAVAAGEDRVILLPAPSFENPLLRATRPELQRKVVPLASAEGVAVLEVVEELGEETGSCIGGGGVGCSVGCSVGHGARDGARGRGGNLRRKLLPYLRLSLSAFVPAPASATAVVPASCCICSCCICSCSCFRCTLFLFPNSYLLHVHSLQSPFPQLPFPARHFLSPLHLESLRIGVVIRICVPRIEAGLCQDLAFGVVVVCGLPADGFSYGGIKLLIVPHPHLRLPRVQTPVRRSARNSCAPLSRRAVAAEQAGTLRWCAARVWSMSIWSSPLCLTRFFTACPPLHTPAGTMQGIPSFTAFALRLHAPAGRQGGSILLHAAP